MVCVLFKAIVFIPRNERVENRGTYLWLSEEHRTTADDGSMEQQGVDFMKNIKETYLLHRILIERAPRGKEAIFLLHETIFKAI